MEHKFQRNVESGGLLNTDSTALEAYKKTREKLTAISELQSDINSVKEEISEIKTLLRKLITQREG
jgi:hypothetical protein